MRWYRLSCRSCGWKAQQPVDERVMKKMTEGLRFCQECVKQNKQVPFTVHEIVTSTRRKP